MTRYQIRRRVQGLLRDDTYPQEVLNEALNRVLMAINSRGRYRFQQATTTIALVTGTYQYNIPSTMIAEKALIYRMGSTSETVITKFPGPIDEILNGGFSGSGVPTTYIRWANQFWFDPIPDATANGFNVSVLHFADIAELVSDLDVPTVPARYHGTVLVYGVAADVAPGLLVRTPEGNVSVQQAYDRVLKDFHSQEYWEPFVNQRLIADVRWNGAEKWGNPGGVR